MDALALVLTNETRKAEWIEAEPDLACASERWQCSLVALSATATRPTPSSIRAFLHPWRQLSALRRPGGWPSLLCLRWQGLYERVGQVDPCLEFMILDQS